MNDRPDVAVCELDMGSPDTLKKLKELEQAALAKWKEQTTTRFAMKLLAHGDGEKAEIVKGLVEQTFEAGFGLGFGALLSHATANAKSIKPNSIPCPGVGEA